MAVLSLSEQAIRLKLEPWACLGATDATGVVLTVVGAYVVGLFEGNTAAGVPCAEVAAYFTDGGPSVVLIIYGTFFVDTLSANLGPALMKLGICAKTEAKSRIGTVKDFIT